MPKFRITQSNGKFIAEVHTPILGWDSVYTEPVQAQAESGPKHYRSKEEAFNDIEYYADGKPVTIVN